MPGRLHDALRGRRSRDIDREDTTASGFVEYVNLTAVDAGAATRNIQPEADARSIVSSLLERSEETFGCPRRQSAAFVPDVDEDPSVRCVGM